MSRQRVIKRAAEIETNKAVIWYETQRPGLGRDFLAEFRRTLDIVSSRPESFPQHYRTARRALLRRFPYAIYFAVYVNQITVIAVLHTSQSQHRLRGRI